jgi:BolA protein
MRDTIIQKLTFSFAPVHLDVINESGRHSIPAGSESHFKAVIISERFVGIPLLDRHRLVNDVLAHELKSGVHALSLTVLTPMEWESRGGQINASPPCLGGSKIDNS